MPVPTVFCVAGGNGDDSECPDSPILRSCASIQSVKVTSEAIMQISDLVTEINEALADAP